jgi:hypothetical protein
MGCRALAAQFGVDVGYDVKNIFAEKKWRKMAFLAQNNCHFLPKSDTSICFSKKIAICFKEYWS